MLEQAILPRQRAPLGFIPQPLLTLVDEPPTGDGWIHQIKHDGYRTQLVIDGSRTRAFTRNGHDWTRHYERVVEAALNLDSATAIIDGEIVMQDEHGRSDFHALHGAIGRKPESLVLYAFDLPHMNDHNLRARPLIERRDALRQLIGEHDPAFPIQFSEHITGDPADLLKAACKMAWTASFRRKRAAATAADGRWPG